MVSPDFVEGFDKRFKKDVDIKSIKTFNILTRKWEVWQNENRINLKHEIKITNIQKRALAEKIRDDKLDISITSKPDKKNETYNVKIGEVNYKSGRISTIWRDSKGHFRKSPI